MNAVDPGPRQARGPVGERSEAVSVVRLGFAVIVRVALLRHG